MIMDDENYEKYLKNPKDESLVSCKYTRYPQNSTTNKHTQTDINSLTHTNKRAHTRSRTYTHTYHTNTQRHTHTRTRTCTRIVRGSNTIRYMQVSCKEEKKLNKDIKCLSLQTTKCKTHKDSADHKVFFLTQSFTRARALSCLLLALV